MMTDVVTLFPAEFQVGDSVFDQTSHRWHEIVGVGSGDGTVLLTTDDGVALSVAASDRCSARLADERHDVALEHQRPRSTFDQLTEQFWD
jgi:ABC-type ATPase with predicted acetyltransferase domain